MPQALTALFDRAKTTWNRISRPQQIALAAGVAISLVLVIVFVVLSQQTSYSVLFSNLQSDDASSIIAKLKTDKIPYQISDGGKAILVPASMVDETRLMLAGDGLPSQGVVGFEIFDKTNPLGMTDFTQQLDYQRGLQGELARTIQQINGVNSARVSIVLPQSSLYTASQDQPTASIVIGMNPGSSLDPGQVKAIMHLTASSVQGLKPENVTVVDTTGTNLSDIVNSQSLANGVTLGTYGSALDVEHAYENQLSQQVASMLNTVVGQGKAVVRINANLNWDQLQQDSTTYTPTNNPIGNQTTNNITSTNGTGDTTTGVPGTGSNLVPTPTATAGTGSGGTNYTQSQANTVYDVSQTVAHLTKAPGSVQRLTVSVFLDGSDAEFPPATITKIQQAVANAIGLDSARGDAITVSALPFNRSTDQAAQAALKAQQAQQAQDTLFRGIALIIAALALVLFAWQATRRRKPRALPASVTMVGDISGQPGLLSGGVGINGELPAPGQEGASSAIMIAEGGEPDEILAIAKQRQVSEAEQARQMEARENLLELARQHPEMVANVVQSWFEETN